MRFDYIAINIYSNIQIRLILCRIFNKIDKFSNNIIMIYSGISCGSVNLDGYYDILNILIKIISKSIL